MRWFFSFYLSTSAPSFAMLKHYKTGWRGVIAERKSRCSSALYPLTFGRRTLPRDAHSVIERVYTLLFLLFQFVL